MVLEGTSRKVVAERVAEWIVRRCAIGFIVTMPEGVEGLGNRRGGGVKLRLTSDQMAQLATWVEDGLDLERDGVVRWRRVVLARRIEEVFGIILHERTIGRYLARLGFRAP